MPQPERKRRTAAEIHSILSDLTESGLSQRHFAATGHIPLSTLQSWIRKYGLPAPSMPKVIRVGTLPDLAASLEIEFPGGEILRCGPGFRSEDLRTVLSELRRC